MVVSTKDKFGNERSYIRGFLIFFKNFPSDAEESWYYKKERRRLMPLLRRLQRDEKDFRVVSCASGKVVSMDKVNNWLSVGKDQEEEVLMLDS